MSQQDKSESNLELFEDNMTAYHPAYAFKKTGKSVMTEKSLFVTFILLLVCIVLDSSPVVIYFQMFAMALWNIFLPSKDPDGTDALKIESYLSKILNNGPLKSISVSARKTALKTGVIPCETTKYIP